MYSVYILQSKKDRTLYVGYSKDLRKRIAEHNKGLVSSTKEKRPIELIYCETYKNRLDAMRREIFFKTGWGRQYTKKVLYNTLKH